MHVLSASHVVWKTRIPEPNVVTTAVQPCTNQMRHKIRPIGKLNPAVTSRIGGGHSAQLQSPNRSKLPMPAHTSPRIKVPVKFTSKVSE